MALPGHPDAHPHGASPPWPAHAANGGEARASAGKVAVVDTVGAGDFFTAGFLYALLNGANLQVGCQVLV